MDKVDKFQNEVIDTVLTLLGDEDAFNGFNRIELIEKFTRLGRIGFQLMQIAVKQSNSQHNLSKTNTDKRNRLRDNAIMIIEEIGLTGHEFGSDPRYAMIKIKMPNGRFNCMDGLWALPEVPFINVTW